jgi:hypothetical protein
MGRGQEDEAILNTKHLCPSARSAKLLDLFLGGESGKFFTVQAGCSPCVTINVGRKISISA